MEYYFASKDDEICYSLLYFKDLMEYEGYDEMILFKAVKQDVDGYFWCKYYQQPSERNEFTCGKWCDHYDPRNGISGICKLYSTQFFEASDETITIKKQ